MSALEAAVLPADVDRQADACEELLTYLHDDLLPRLGAPDPEQSIAAFSWRSLRRIHHLRSGGAARRDGFGYQAAMLNRSLFEAMVDAYWVSKHPELAVARWRDHAAYLMTQASEPASGDRTATVEHYRDEDVVFPPEDLEIALNGFQPVCF